MASILLYHSLGTFGELITLFTGSGVSRELSSLGPLSLTPCGFAAEHPAPKPEPAFPNCWLGETTDGTGWVGGLRQLQKGGMKSVALTMYDTQPN